MFSVSLLALIAVEGPGLKPAESRYTTHEVSVPPAVHNRSAEVSVILAALKLLGNAQLKQVSTCTKSIAKSPV